MGRRGLRFVRFRDAVAQDPQSRLDLPPFPLTGDDPKHGEDVLHRFEMIAAIADDVNDSDDAPVLELMQAGADIRTGYAERFDDLVRGQRLLGEEEKSVNLGDGAIDPPAGPHFAPMEDE